MLPGIAVGVGGSWLLRQASVGVAAGYCVALAIAGFSVLALAKGLLSRIEAPLPPAHGRKPPPEPANDVLAPLERRLAAAVRERRLYVAGLQPLLYEVARERLRLRHTLDLDRVMRHDPDLARRTLGDEPWTWLTTRDLDGRPPTPHQLRTVITAIEAL